MALAALTAAVADLRQSQQRLHQAEAAYASADRLRSVAPTPQTATAAAPRRPKNAADLAAMSFGHKLGKVRPYKKPAPPTSKKANTDPGAQRKRDPGQGRGPKL